MCIVSLASSPYLPVTAFLCCVVCCLGSVPGLRHVTKDMKTKNMKDAYVTSLITAYQSRVVPY